MAHNIYKYKKYRTYKQCINVKNMYTNKNKTIIVNNIWNDVKQKQIEHYVKNTM